MGLFVRTIGTDRVRTRIGLANLAYNFQRLVFHERRAAVACVCSRAPKRGPIPRIRDAGRAVRRPVGFRHESRPVLAGHSTRAKVTRFLEAFN